MPVGWRKARFVSMVFDMERREYEWIPEATASRPVREAGDRLAPGSITACLVVRHEAATIERCLQSLSGVVDEIVVVHDGACADGTLDIASRFGCRVFVVPRYGHGCEHHLPFAYQEARGEWLLTIDADEFLSPELRTRLRALTAAPEADGYEFLWKLWNGRRYVTERGPYKLTLVRRAAMRMIGVLHTKGDVDGVVKRLPLHLEHRPPYNNFSLRTIATKWRARARVQASEYLADLNSLPRFNYPGTVRWTARRTWANRCAPLLILPAGLHTFLFVERRLRGELGFSQRVHFAATQALYRAMVTAYLAKGGLAARSTSGSPGPLSTPST